MIGEFVLCRDADLQPAGWVTRELGSWRLSHPPGVPAAALVRDDGSDGGWLLGYPIDAAGELLDGSRPVQVDRGVFDEWLMTLGGRFVAFALDEQGGRVVPDSSGSLPIVHSWSNGWVGSTPALLPLELGPPAQELAQHLGIPVSDNWYPFELTSRVGLKRLLPNHQLSLRDGSVTRHAPRPVPSSSPSSVEEVAAVVAAVVKRHLAALCSRFQVNFPLTGGRESRVMLACARPFVSRLQAFTVPFDDRMGAKDLYLAPKIAELAGLDHRVLENTPATEGQRADWLERVGHCVAGRTLDSCAISLQLPSGPDTFDVGGIAGEAGRAYYWRRNEDADSKLSAEDLVARLGLPIHPVLMEQAEVWLAELTGFDTLTVLDLAYLEIRVGCWAAPMSQGNLGDRAIRCLWPLAHMDSFDAWRRSRPEDRRKSAWVDAILEQEWPELLRFPFNRLSPWQKLVRGVRRFRSTATPC